MKTRVLIIESESGWGQKVDEIKEFETKELAEDFANTYNRTHNAGALNKSSVPDWYMYAQVEGVYGMFFK